MLEIMNRKQTKRLKSSYEKRLERTIWLMIPVMLTMLFIIENT